MQKEKTTYSCFERAKCTKKFSNFLIANYFFTNEIRTESYICYKILRGVFPSLNCILII